MTADVLAGSGAALLSALDFVTPQGRQQCELDELAEERDHARDLIAGRKRPSTTCRCRPDRDSGFLLDPDGWPCRHGGDFA